MKINNQNLSLYSFLSSFSQPKSYQGKIMLVAFLGTHIPLLTLLLAFLVSNSFSLAMTVSVLAIALVATLVGTGVTLYALHKLLLPVSLTYRAQRAYINNKQLPNLPTNFTDEVGILMADTVRTITKLDETIEHLTNYDEITGLPNRILFSDRLQQILSRSSEQNQLNAVICLNLTNFREINNALGSDAGDRLLRAVGQLLSASLSPTDILCRLGNDQFAIARPNLTASVSVGPFCQMLLDKLTLPISLMGNEVQVKASLGIAVYPFDGSQVAQLLQNANTAIDEAKKHATSNYQFYGADMNARLQERLTLENKLHYALARNEFQLHYQPKVDVNSGQILGVEALLRWQNPDLGGVSPAKFIPIAEANGLIIPIGEWVLRTACTQNRLWQEAGLPPLKMAVNLSPCQFAQSNLVERVASILEETQLNAAYLELEVTESLLMENIQQSINVLQQLHEMGISLALDDFGTGYSSLNYLSRFPIDTLKIDRSFVRDIVVNADDAAITNAIIALAKSLQLNIIAEGVETQEQFEYLKAQNCNEIQGYYFSRPIPALALAELLNKNQNLSHFQVA